MFIPPKVQFFCNSKCNLNCEFCVKSDIDLDVNMDMHTFKTYANKFIRFGTWQFELTPMVGETFSDKSIVNRIKFLSEKGVRVSAFTNLINVDSDIINKLKYFNNFYLYLSIYGNTEETFIRRTNGTKEAFHKFKTNYTDLYTHFIRSSKPAFNIGEITYRFKHDNFDNKNPIDFITNMLQTFKLCENFYVFGDDYNWKDLIKVEKDLDTEPVKREVKGICKQLINDIGVWPNGDVGICSGWFDVNKRMILGNINESSLEDIFKQDSLFTKIMIEQRSGLYRSLCSQCDYITKNPDPFITYRIEN